MENFVEWLKINYPEFLNEQDNSIKPWMTSPVYNPIAKKPSTIATPNASLKPSTIATPNASLQQDEQKNQNNLGFRPDEIIIQKNLIPKQMIRNAQFDVKKWDADFNKLQQPSQGDMGFATSQEFFDKPVKMLVVTRSGMTRVKGASTGGFFNHSSRTMVMPDELFDELPTPTSDGKLTPEGAETLAHELRHSTQQGKVPFDRNQGKVGFFPPGQQDTTKKVTPAWFQYLNDPREMGVRLAAIKNYMSKESLFKIADLSKVDRLKEYAKPLIAFLPEDEKRIFHYILHPDEWYNAFAKGKNYSPWDQSRLESACRILINDLRRQNTDVDSLLDFYYLIDTDNKYAKFKKEIYKELMDNYDQVVKTGSPNTRANYG